MKYCNSDSSRDHLLQPFNVRIEETTSQKKLGHALYPDTLGANTSLTTNLRRSGGLQISKNLIIE